MKGTNGIFTEDKQMKQIELICKDINEIMDYKARGAMIRARADWHMLAEKPSSYFLRLEKYNYTKKNRYRLIRESTGEIVTESKDILNEQYKFCQKLFSEERVLCNPDYFSDIEPIATKIKDSERIELDEPIQKEEIVQVLKEHCSREGTWTRWASCCDLSCFFYSKLEKLVFDLIKEIEAEGITIDEGRGIISLMDKPGKGMLYLANWRPLMMINMDVKLYSKILANRLYRVLPSIIHNDQSGFLKTRYIGENLLDLLSMIEHCEFNDINGLIVALDFHKAFDKVSWEMFYKILTFFNFGNEYISKVKKLFTNITSTTINNGFASDWISLERGFRQRDCYSPPSLHFSSGNFRIKNMNE